MKKNELDSRNSEDKENDIWTESSIDYNNSNWTPISIKLSDLHSKFSVTIDLSLPDNAKEMTPEMAKKILKDLMA